MRTALDARLRARALDRDLAVGIAPWRSPAHAARYGQLVSRRRRRALATSLRRLLEEARHPDRYRVGATVPPARKAVRDCEGMIEELIDALDSQRPVDARGIVRLRRLLSDGAGPLYFDARAGDLARALERVEQWLAADG